MLVLQTDNSDRAVSRIKKNDNSIEKISLAWKLSANSTSPPFNISMFEEFKDSRPYILNPKFSAPTSLPLYFFFGYQLFLESGLMEQCGPVSKESLLFRSLIKIFFCFKCITINLPILVFYWGQVFKCIFSYLSDLSEYNVVGLLTSKYADMSSDNELQLREGYVTNSNKTLFKHRSFYWKH